MNQAKELIIHFDYVKHNLGATIGVFGYKAELERTPVLQKVKEESLEEIEWDNQFHLSLRALLLSLEAVEDHLKKNAYHPFSVRFCNQNDLIFKWLTEQSYDCDYAELFDPIYNIIERLVSYCKFEFKSIEGKNNRVKKALKAKMKKNTSKSQNSTPQKLDFSFMSDKLATYQNNRDKAVGEAGSGNQTNGGSVVPFKKFSI